MANEAIIDLVKLRLPFIPTDSSKDDLINSIITEVFYLVQKCSGLSNDDVEDETKYTGLLKYLVVRYVCYLLIYYKIIEIVGGINGAVPSVTKRIKKAKADVVEAEFDYAKASDGSTLSMEATNLMRGLISEICNYASMIGCTLGICTLCNGGAAKTAPWKFYQQDPFQICKQNYNPQNQTP